MSEELSVQYSVDLMQWSSFRDDDKFREYILERLRRELGDAIIKAVGEGWIVSSSVTTSEFDSIRNYTGDNAWLRMPELEREETTRAWPPRRVFVMAVRMDKPLPTQDRFGVPIVALTQDATRPPDRIYYEWSRTPWAGDVWPPKEEPA